MMSIQQPRSIYAFIISLFLCSVAITGHAQKKDQPSESPKIPLLNGIYVYGDVAPVITSTILNNSTYSFEGGAQINLKYKYFPVFEAGIGGANKLSTNNIGFKTIGPFARIGVDLNLLKQKDNTKPVNNFFLAGVRLGFSNFRYNITNAVVTDDYWGETRTINYTDISATKVWAEVVAGVKVETFKNIYMGWQIRKKFLFSQDASGSPSPWYIPGFGIKDGSNWGFNYTIGYKF